MEKELTPCCRQGMWQAKCQCSLGCHPCKDQYLHIIWISAVALGVQRANPAHKSGGYQGTGILVGQASDRSGRCTDISQMERYGWWITRSSIRWWGLSGWNDKWRTATPGRLALNTFINLFWLVQRTCSTGCGTRKQSEEMAHNGYGSFNPVMQPLTCIKEEAPEERESSATNKNRCRSNWDDGMSHTYSKYFILLYLEHPCQQAIQRPLKSLVSSFEYFCCQNMKFIYRGWLRWT